jgi:hypothetical protein
MAAYPCDQLLARSQAMPVSEFSSSHFGNAYPNRITCFIDMLGFSRDIEQIETNPSLFFSIDAVLRRIGKCKADIDRKRASIGTAFDARMTHFSDCLVISYLPEPNAALRALWDAAFLGHVLLRPGYLPRGVITFGRLHHDDMVVYGAALVEAACLEKHDVITPRIMITDSVMKLVRVDLERSAVPKPESAYVRDNGSGPFVHILGKEWSFLQKERELEKAGELEGDGMRELFEELRVALPLRFLHAPGEHARQKLIWMRDYISRLHFRPQNPHHDARLPIALGLGQIGTWVNIPSRSCTRLFSRHRRTCRPLHRQAHIRPF